MAVAVKEATGMISSLECHLRREVHPLVQDGVGDQRGVVRNCFEALMSHEKCLQYSRRSVD